MELTLPVLAALVILAGLFILIRHSRGKRDRAGIMRREYARLLGQPPAAAEETIRRQLEILQQKYPDRSEEWYLEKMIYDLERDR